ncbi:MAG TPA: GNAT family N-acetyltransferase [Thermoleophilaceae bacterium]|jgi:RimJ/RimL family protein N-acetyltransferase|nr:GNAT family N-acetyltransferase [Thermoleophilaceae bacterium]
MALTARTEGRLVVVEPLSREHEEGLFEAARDPEVWAHLTAFPDAYESRERFHAWMEEALAATAVGSEGAWAIIDRSTERPIGSTRYLTLRPEWHSLEIGWTWLARRAWGSGANVETKLLLLTRAFEQLGRERVEFKTDALNARSRAALAALPAQFEGIWRRHMPRRDGSWRDSAWYSVIAPEWPSVKEQLESRMNRVVSR